MLVTTTNTLDGKTIEQYYGVVVGEAVMGANVIKDIFASIRDIVGGRAGSYEQELTKARKIAFTELTEEARLMGANAVIGVDIDYEAIGKNGSILMVSISGTAVKFRDDAIVQL